MKKPFFYLTACFLIVACAGCSTLPRKFVRKKKEPAHKAAVVYLEEGAHQKKYSNEYYYKTHYTLWKTWQDETLGDLDGGNSKKLVRSAEEAQSQLEQMGHYLKPEKQAELQPMIDEMTRFAEKFRNSVYLKNDAIAMRNDLERVKRLIANDFYYDKVKADVLPDEVDLEAGP